MAYKTTEMNIEKDLFDAWQKQRRKTDVEELMEITGKGKNLIYWALQYGYVKDEAIVDTITNFYIARSKKQREKASLITGKTDENE
jgi:hypothetical protein